MATSLSLETKVNVKKEKETKKGEGRRGKKEKAK